MISDTQNNVVCWKPAAPPCVLGVGELLWDILPNGSRMGGAAANFIYHSHIMGADSHLISRIGDDEIGRTLLNKLQHLKLATSGIQTDKSRPTGAVDVKILAQGQPEFHIRPDSAWDNIKFTPDALVLINDAQAIYFGTLAQRSAASRLAIRTMLDAAPSTALRIFDANLRQNFYSKQLLHESLQVADIVKVSDTELECLAEFFSLRGSCKNQMAQLLDRYNLKLIACTRGNNGSILFNGSQWCSHPGLTIAVRDTIGAGDSFTAAITMGLLYDLDIHTISELANTVAAYVASCEGAMPPMPSHLFNAIPSFTAESCTT